MFSGGLLTRRAPFHRSSVALHSVNPFANILNAITTGMTDPLDEFDPKGFLRQFAFPKAQKNENILEGVEWPPEFPFTDSSFRRFDESHDGRFYDSPRLVQHIDDGARAALTWYYTNALPGGENTAHLDLCSSWVSHFPTDYRPKRCAGLGMNEYELSQNEKLTERVVHDMNKDPRLPFDDNSFDVITNVVSVDYLNKPREVFREMYRVLKPGGLAIMSFSNRCFPTKAIAVWLQSSDLQHCGIVGSYFRYANFTNIQAYDVSRPMSDPMYVVRGNKPDT
ncbi:unnamed protein product [Vitrella brassicaformis CCMP3155]|uniref:Methyltransferase type 11 domain-containing protein n=1 Tax=Vitrella brassicaformis (strain CCMP3155) TaxID=1169540 RepID=A0A0G4EPH8_VITBC|nr:unnamed protein product [Vitrella brassicaformis CCMP3155]|eukprot:CEL99344.1 unnamed protein product [Vitrella brassicaformis CCMP3155]